MPRQRHKAFRYRYRNHGKQEAVTFEPAFPALTVKGPWGKAGDAAKLVAEGKNPRHEWRNLMALPVCVNELIEDHYRPDAKKTNRKSTLRDYRSQIGAHMEPKIGPLPVPGITDDDAMGTFASVEAKDMSG